MTFLPKSADSHNLLDFVIALPLTVLGTAFLYFLIEAGTRGLGV